MRKLILPGLIFIVLIISAILLVTRPAKDTVPPKVDTASENTAMLNGLAQTLDIKPELRNYNYMDWIGNDNMVLPLSGKQFIMGTVNVNGIGKYKQIPENNLQAVTIKNLQPMLTSADTYFTSQGYNKSAVNTRTVGSQITSVFIGYEKDNSKCVIRIDEQSDPFGNFVCGTVDTKQIEMQQPFTSLFYGTTYYEDPITSFRVEKNDGNFAMGSANGAFSGYTWMAKKTDGVWAVAWRGQEIPMCTDMVNAGLPESLYVSCYSE